MTHFKPFLLLLNLVFLFSSCSTSDDDIIVPGKEEKMYTNGLFVLNEGNFGSGNASISFFDPEQEEMVHQVYKKENEAELLGDVGQSMETYENYIFIVLNASNKIVVVDRQTFQKVTVLESQLQNPRDVSFADGKAFVTNWGDLYVPDDDYIAVYNVTDFSFIKAIPVEEGPEQLISGNGFVIASHQGGYGMNTIISLLDPASLEVIKTLDVGDRPKTMAFLGEQLWVLSEGRPAWTEAETPGRLSQVNLVSLEVEQQFVFPSTSDHPSHLTENNGKLFYTLEKGLYVFEPGTSALAQIPLFEMDEVDVLYGLGMQGSSVFAASASPDFSSNGKVLQYDLSGELLKNLEAGINPNGFLFNP